MATKSKKITKVVEQVIRPEDGMTFPCGAKLTGYISLHPLYTDEQANKFGRAFDWLREKLNGLTIDQVEKAWETGKVGDLSVPKWVISGLSIVTTADDREAAKKQRRKEWRAGLRGYGWRVTVRTTSYTITSVSRVKMSPTDRKRYQETIGVLRNKSTYADVLQDILDRLKSALTAYETAIKPVRSYLGPGVPILRGEVLRVQKIIDGIVKQSLGKAA